MGRAIGGAVLGYIVMFVIVFCGLTVAWMLLGADGAFRPGVYDVSMTWVAISLVVAIVAALAGGKVARVVAKAPLGPQILAGLVIIIGIVSMIPAMTMEPTIAARAADMPMMEAIAQARTPVWMMILNPIIGAIGALIGGGAATALAATR